ncbi:MAG: FAD-binding protein [Candidatus Abyssobacteria bacterium SURF_17]|uniref:FAD-binding protein n=1 Tax=Candidatus Abyssobacteria bacterium SURF_17 TaxID=2093361 RepID=A0A419EN30_9BACT|nr:MAG: FAD-binding protein [Candidatus Abyssubacteria bacterium SURF_17]
MEADVIVIGGGMAGAIAALRASSLGANVILIRKGHGSSAMSSGTIDIAGPTAFLPLDSWDSLPSIPDRLGEMLRTHALHPYSIVAGGRTGLGQVCYRLRQACDFLLDKVPGLQLDGSTAQNLALPTILGTVKFTAFAPSSLAGGNLREMRDAHVLVVGVRGLMFFQPHVCKQSLERYSSLHAPSSIGRVEVVEADMPRLASAAPATPFEAARSFDDPLTVEKFAQSLANSLPSDATHIAVPPILGLNRHAETYEIISRELRPKIFELISPTFSVPGHRLQVELEAALQRNSVRVVTTDVVDAKRDGRIVRNLVLEDMKSKRTATAKSFIIATGKFSTGGLVANDFPKEPIFKLPLFVGGKRVDNGFVQDLLSWNVDGRQLFLSCGLHIDDSLRPLDTFGEPAYENLFAAGAVIGEYDYVTDKCGMGVAALTGYLVGENAATLAAR